MKRLKQRSESPVRVFVCTWFPACKAQVGGMAFNSTQSRLQRLYGDAAVVKLRSEIPQNHSGGFSSSLQSHAHPLVLLSASPLGRRPVSVSSLPVLRWYLWPENSCFTAACFSLSCELNTSRMPIRPQTCAQSPERNDYCFFTIGGQRSRPAQTR